MASYSFIVGESEATTPNWWVTSREKPGSDRATVGQIFFNEENPAKIFNSIYDNSLEARELQATIAACFGSKLELKTHTLDEVLTRLEDEGVISNSEDGAEYSDHIDSFGNRINFVTVRSPTTDKLLLRQVTVRSRAGGEDKLVEFETWMDGKYRHSIEQMDDEGLIISMDVVLDEAGGSCFRAVRGATVWEGKVVDAKSLEQAWMRANPFYNERPCMYVVSNASHVSGQLKTTNVYRY